jgi:hypothetical protein
MLAAGLLAAAAAYRGGKELLDKYAESHTPRQTGDGHFDGYVIKIVFGATGRRDRFEFFYGGAEKPDGTGHGHVVSNDGVNIHYWREPNRSSPIIDDRWSTEKLNKYGL